MVATLQTVSTVIGPDQVGFEPTKTVKLTKATAALRRIKQSSDLVNMSMHSKHVSTTASSGQKFLLTLHASISCRRQGAEVGWRPTVQTLCVVQLLQN